MCFSHSSMRRFRFITAPHDGGKTRWILEHCRGCRGFVSVSPDEEKKEIFLMNLETGEKRLLMRRNAENVFIVDEETFSYANDCIMRETSGLVVLDECGWMECGKRGFYPSLVHLRDTPSLSALLSVRLDRLEWYLDFFGRECACVIRL